MLLLWCSCNGIWFVVTRKIFGLALNTAILFHYPHNMAPLSGTEGAYLLVCNKANELNCELLLHCDT
jgi:hypothetical protein